jgi:hypothetical protein
MHKHACTTPVSFMFTISARILLASFNSSAVQYGGGRLRGGNDHTRMATEGDGLPLMFKKHASNAVVTVVCVCVCVCTSVCVCVCVHFLVEEQSKYTRSTLFKP